MTINKFEHEWANSGIKSTLTDDQKDDGWASPVRPRRDLLNALQNRAETKINDIIIERVRSGADQATDNELNQMIMTGLWDKAWGLTSDDNNVISAGATKEFVDIAVFFDSGNNPRIMALDVANTKIEVYDARTLTSIITTDDLANDLPSGSGETWEPYSFCTDGIYVYVLFKDSNASPYTHIIQCWEINEADANWSVRTGWNATGTALPDTGSVNGHSQVIIADGTYICVSCQYKTITASGDAALILFTRATGANTRDGAGDAPTAASASIRGRIASDGTNIYFTAFGTPKMYICSATIADLTSGTGRGNQDTTMASDFAATLCVGNDLIFTAIKTPDATITNKICWIQTSSNVDIQQLALGEDTSGTPLTGDQTTLYTPYDICFDGLNIWILTKIRPQGNAIALTRIDAAQLILVNHNIDIQLPDISKTFIIDPENANDDDYCRCAFDGRDIWFILESSASQTNSGKIFRLPLALLR